MKIQATFKTPDAMHWIKQRLKTELALLAEENGDLDLDEVESKLETWIRYGEEIHIEFDLKAMTAKVISRK